MTSPTRFRDRGATDVGRRPSRGFADRLRRASRSVWWATVCMLVLHGVVPAAASTLTNGLRLVDRNYLFASELDAGRLLGRALEYAEARIPEVRARAAGGSAYVLTAGACRLRLEAPPEATVPDLGPLLRKAAALIDRCITEPPDNLPPSESLMLSGLLDGLDPYSTVFDNERKTEHTIQFRGKLAGIGARIGIRNDRLQLITVYEDAPARKAGLRDGDVVARIDGVSTTNMPVSDAVQLIRGAVGTDVKLDVEREGSQELQTISVTRGLVTIPSVTARLMESGVIYSEITHFSQTTPDDFRRVIAEILVANDDLKGVVIDLRANSGGSMLGSSAIGDLFLDHGLLITTAGRDGMHVSGLTSKIEARPEAPFFHLPVAILTSPRTASGSELLAASLRNNDRAILLGERTFGKGTVQKTYSLGSEASLKLTVGHFLPNGRAIPGGGLEPNVEIRRIYFSKSSVLIPLYRDDQELPFWLRTPDWLDAEDPWTPTVISFARELSDSETATEAADDEAAGRSERPFDEAERTDAANGEPDDPLVGLAAEVLSRFGSTSATEMMIASRTYLEEHAAEADRDLQEFMKRRGVDWRAAARARPLSGDAKPAVEVSVEPADGFLRAGEPADLTVRVTNAGAMPLYRVQGRLSSEAYFLSGRGLLFGHIAPGQSRSWNVKVEPPRAQHAGRVKVGVELHDDAGPIQPPGPFILAVEDGPRPRLAHRVAIVGDDSAAADATPRLLAIDVEVRNRGTGAAESVKVVLRHPASNDFEPVEGTATIDRIEPGEVASARLSVRLLTSADPPTEAELIVSEPVFRLFYETPLRLAGTSGYGRWREAPDIRLQALRLSEAAPAYRMIAEVSDDGALDSLWTRIDGDQIDYLDPHAGHLEIDLPWTPKDGVKHVEIVATDDDGLVTRYVTDL